MSDDLAWFPTPKEAFKQSAKPAHLSPAYESVSNVPPPPLQERHRHPPTRKQVDQVRHFSDPSTAGMGTKRTFSPQSHAIATPYSPAQVAAAANSSPAHASQYDAQSAYYADSRPASHQHMRPQQPIDAQTRVHSHPRAERAPVGRQAYPAQVHQGQVHQGQVHQGQAPSGPYANVSNVAGPTPIDPGARPLLNPAARDSSSSSLSSVASSGHLPAHAPPREPQVAPPQTNVSPDLRTLFDSVDGHKRGYLTERELSKALVNADYTLFDSHTVRLLMKMFDRDGDGAIYFAEFGQLWKYLHDWRQVFERFDANRNDNISLEEFSKALAAFGYTLSTACVRFMFGSGSKLNRQGQRAMSFDMFVQSCISIKSITDTFKKYDTDRDGYVTIAFEDFLMETTKLH